MSSEKLSYPIGHYQAPEPLTAEHLQTFIADIASFPARLRAEVGQLTDEQLDTPYRPEGWTIRQVVHHCADSHMNSLTRLKLALTEEAPVIRPYFEERWAELADTKTMPIAPALKMLEGIHERWTVLLRSLTAADFARTFVHPQHGTIYRLDVNTGLYAWHGNHHLAHITTLKKTKGWQ